MTSPITNAYDPEATCPKLDVERVVLYAPETAWTYSHHASIAFFNGRFFAIWSNGRVNEDDVGQRVLIASSEDFASWTAPRPLVDTIMGKHSELVLTAAGFHEHAGTLVAYFGQYEYRPEALVDGHRTPGGTSHMDVGLWALTTADGETWTEPTPLGLPMVPNHGPQPTRSGRLIISGNIMFPWTDNPSGLAGWTKAGVYPREMADEVVDDSGGFRPVAERAGWESPVCEGSFFATDAGVIHMMFRSYTGFLWHAESRDDGETWSEPTRTAFTDNGTKFHFGRLPDGRFTYVGCPDPREAPADRRRCPLVLSLSEDGVRFDRHFILGDAYYTMKREGMHKGGQYGYPHTMLHEGRLYAIVSRRKEAVEVLRVPIDAL